VFTQQWGPEKTRLKNLDVRNICIAAQSYCSGAGARLIHLSDKRRRLEVLIGIRGLMCAAAHNSTMRGTK
jgi:hypothetical protein